MDTIGGLIDKLITVDTKMWNNQELLYEIRRMSFEEFKERYIDDKDGTFDLWNTLKKCCDLNVQRSDLIDEIDETIVTLARKTVYGEATDGFVQKKHKTY